MHLVKIKRSPLTDKSLGAGVDKTGFVPDGIITIYKSEFCIFSQDDQVARLNKNAFIDIYYVDHLYGLFNRYVVGDIDENAVLRKGSVQSSETAVLHVGEFSVMLLDKVGIGPESRREASGNDSIIQRGYRLLFIDIPSVELSEQIGFKIVYFAPEDFVNILFLFKGIEVKIIRRFQGVD